MLGDTEIDLNEEGSHYSLLGGNLVISNPVRTKHVGKYSCLATNMYGTIISGEASVQFGCKSLRYELSLTLGWKVQHLQRRPGAVLSCVAPTMKLQEYQSWIISGVETHEWTNFKLMTCQCVLCLFLFKATSTEMFELHTKYLLEVDFNRA